MEPLSLPEQLKIFGRRIRLRYVAASLFVLIAVSGLFSLLPEGDITVNTSVAGVASDETIETEMEQALEAKRQMALQAVEENPELPFFVLPGIKPSEVSKTAELRSGDTLAGFLNRNYLSKSESYNVVEAFRKVYDPRQVKAGEKFKLNLKNEAGQLKLLSLEYSPSVVEAITIARGDESNFIASKDEKELTKRQRSAQLTVENSLYGSAAKVGLPNHVIMDLIYIYSWKVDFQRDMRSGTTIEVLYEDQVTDDGESLNDYKILYASMNIGGTDIPVYRFEDEEGLVDFYTEDGKSIRQGLLKTPIAFGRISSGYGKRKHPILGYTKMHKGIDFAAPRGTKIFAAADGVISKKYRSSSYGNYIRINHNGSIQTAYAHLKGFAKGMGVGKRVKQGQVIGYVGTTGRSTGPHLHYEVLKNGRHVNPKAVDLPTQNELKGAKKKQFKIIMASLESKFRDKLKEFDIRVATGKDENEFN